MNETIVPAFPASAPAIPESAPFSPEQRAWLNGFLAGLWARPLAAGAGAAPLAAAAPLRPVSILFGTQTGTSEALARRAAKLAAAKGFAATVIDMGELAIARLAEERHVLVITSTYGDGEPPDSVRALHGELMAATAPRLERIRFSVLALGDTNYQHFCRCGKEIDERLEQLGATRVAARVDCDTDYERAFLAWLDAALAGLGSATPASASAAPAPEIAAGYSRQRPYPALLRESRNLSGEGSGKRVHHVAFRLEDSGLAYEPGDALGVWPHNCPAVVAEVLRAIGCDGEEEVALLDGSAWPLRRALTERLDLGRPGAELAARLGAAKETPEMAPAHVPDLLRLRPEARLTAAELVRMLRPLAPRLYSIASSPRAHPGEVHLTVGLVRYDAHGRSRRGLCSGFLAERCAAEETRAGVFVHANANFRLPDDPSVPIIMVGPGTGIAPFRGFLADRHATGASGRAWLFFGDQRSATDFLYRDELERYRAAGTLTRFDTAFSRDQEEKIYVQHRMRESADSLYAWLEEGAYFYVCGDASRMARDVDLALQEAIVTGGGRTPEQAAAYVQALRAARRYRRDVY